MNIKVRERNRKDLKLQASVQPKFLLRAIPCSLSLISSFCFLAFACFATNFLSWWYVGCVPFFDRMCSYTLCSAWRLHAYKNNLWSSKQDVFFLGRGVNWVVSRCATKLTCTHKNNLWPRHQRFDLERDGAGLCPLLGCVVTHFVVHHLLHAQKDNLWPSYQVD